MWHDQFKATDIPSMATEKDLAAKDSGLKALRDRRRHGRVQEVVPSLLPLLRNEINPSAIDGFDKLQETTGQLRAIKGILIGVLLSAVLWVMLYWVIVAIGGFVRQR